MLDVCVYAVFHFRYEVCMGFHPLVCCHNSVFDPKR